MLDRPPIVLKPDQSLTVLVTPQKDFTEIHVKCGDAHQLSPVGSLLLHFVMSDMTSLSEHIRIQRQDGLTYVYLSEE